MSTEHGVERAVLEGVIPALQAEGYQVYFRPSPAVLPPFMKGYRPDAVALKPGKNIAIDVLSRPRTGVDDRERMVRDIFSDHGDWERRVYYVPSGAAEPIMAVGDPSNVQRLIDNVAALSGEAHGVPALLSAWGAFEAVGRAIIPDQLSRPQPAARLLEVLASAGYVTPKEAEELRPLVHLRNRAAHGDFTVQVSKDQLDRLIATVRTLLALWPDEDARS